MILFGTYHDPIAYYFSVYPALCATLMFETEVIEEFLIMLQGSMLVGTYNPVFSDTVLAVYDLLYTDQCKENNNDEQCST